MFIQSGKQFAISTTSDRAEKFTELFIHINERRLSK